MSNLERNTTSAAAGGRPMTNTGRGIPYTGKVVAMRPTSTMLLQLVEAGYTGAQHAWPDVLYRLADLRYEEAAELLRWHRRTGDWLALVNSRRAAAIAQEGEEAGQ